MSDQVVKLLVYSSTDVGKKRNHNEDSFLSAPEMGLFAVADGMGGHQGGEQASRIAVQTLKSQVNELPDEATREQILEALCRATQASGAAIFEHAQANPDLHGMGTTLTALWIQRGRAYLSHVGDSRAYLYRDGQAQQLSDDHTWVHEQVSAGMMTEEEAKEHKFRHVITRSVGFEREVVVDGAVLPVQPGDCYVLCSDGLSNYLPTDELGQILCTNYYRDVPKLLVELANERGGEDNVTVVLLKFGD